MRFVRGLLVALGITAVLATPVAAFVLKGWYYTSAIDTNSDGAADLSVCYGTSTSAALYVNRSDVDQEIEQWHGASFGAFSSNGLCDGDGSNIEMLMRSDLGSCGPVTGGVFGATENKGNNGYSQKKVWFNTNCLPHFDWYDADGIDGGKISALAVALHEAGHALGMDHSGDPDAVMHTTGPTDCSPVGNDWLLADDDAEAYRTRYLGINDTATVFPEDPACPT